MRNKLEYTDTPTGRFFWAWDEFNKRYYKIFYTWEELNYNDIYR